MLRGKYDSGEVVFMCMRSRGVYTCMQINPAHVFFSLFVPEGEICLSQDQGSSHLSSLLTEHVKKNTHKLKPEDDLCVFSCVCFSPYRSVLSRPSVPWKDPSWRTIRKRIIGLGAIPGSSQQPLMRSCKTNGKEQRKDVNSFLRRKRSSPFFSLICCRAEGFFLSLSVAASCGRVSQLDWCTNY